MNDFRALSGFIDQVLRAAKPIDEGSRDYFLSIMAPRRFAKLSSKMWHAYKGAENELASNVSLLVDKQELINYLKEAKAFLNEPPEFKSLVIEGSEFVSKGLIKANSHISTTERALQYMNQLITQAWDIDLKTGQNSGTGELSFASKKYIAFLQLYATGAYECWKRLEEGIERHMRLATPSSPPKRKKPGTSDFDLTSFPEEVGMKSTMIQTIGSVLESMRAIVKKPKGGWEPTTWGATGHPFIAVMRLLIHYKKAHKITRGQLSLWVDFFMDQYGVDINEGTSKQQINNGNTVFQAAVDKAYKHLARQIPSLKLDYQKPK